MFPVHPRTRQKLAQFGLAARVAAQPRLRPRRPRRLSRLPEADGPRARVLTFGRGSEETTLLGVPCLTLRGNTERPVTVELGTNRLVGQQPERILAAYREVMRGHGARGGRPPLWDGRAAGRIVGVLREAL